MSRGVKVSGAIQDTAVMTVLTVISTGLHFGATLFLARALEPEMFGQWQMFLVVMTYIPMFDFGVSVGIARDIPFFIGKKDDESYRRTAATTLSWGLGSSVLIFIGLSVGGVLASADYLRKGLPLLGLYTVFYCISNYAQSMLVAHQGLRLASFVNFLRVTLRAVSIVGLYRLGPQWILMGWIGTEIFVVLFILRYAAHVSFYWGLDVKILKRLLNLGFPTFLLGLVAWQTCAGDRAIVAMFLDERSLGYYGLASNLSAVILTLAKQVAQTMQTRILRRYGETQSVESIREYVLEPCVALSRVLPFIIGVGLFAVPLLFYYALPKYLPALPMALTLIVTCFFISVPQTPVSLLLALEKQWLLLGIWVVSLVSNLVFNFLFLKWGMGMRGISIGTGLSWIVAFLAYFTVTLSYYMNKRQSLLFMGNLVGPLAYALAVAGLSAAVLSRFFGYAVMLHLGLAAFCTAYTPVLWAVNRKYHVFHSTLHYLRRWGWPPPAGRVGPADSKIG